MTASSIAWLQPPNSDPTPPHPTHPSSHPPTHPTTQPPACTLSPSPLPLTRTDTWAPTLPAACRQELLDELLPKATGREAKVEARAARREAARAREDSPPLMRVTGGGDIMGGDDSFAAAKAR